MNVTYEVIPEEEIAYCKDLCNELMTFQKAKAHIKPELFDSMNFDTRMIPSIKSAMHNYVVIVKDDDKVVGYVYANVSPKETYVNAFATFFDLSSVAGANVGCLSQFFLKEEYRQKGIGSILFDMSIKWLNEFVDIEDYFVFVSNGNDDALAFYQRKGFVFSHKVLDGFISVLRRRRAG